MLSLELQIITDTSCHARARVGNLQFSPISPTSRTHVRQYAEGQIPGTCTRERTHARACAISTIFRGLHSG